MKNIPLILFLIVISTAITASAQRQTSPKAPTTISVVGSMQTVKGAPFSAEAISEGVQILADGNKISRSHTTRLYRDGEGRFRREKLDAPSNTSANNPRIAQALGFQGTVSIFDPVANQNFILNPTEKTARRGTFLLDAAESAATVLNAQAFSQTGRNRFETTDSIQGTKIILLPELNSSGGGNGSGAGKTESLGTRSIEGVEAEGTRSVTTIPAGTIGNERDIEFVYERWYSKDLQMVVYSKNSNPLSGEQTYRLVNINRIEPDRSLFVVPADFKIVAEPKFTTITTTAPVHKIIN